jgi:hypothetical protein
MRSTQCARFRTMNKGRWPPSYAGLSRNTLFSRGTCLDNCQVSGVRHGIRPLRLLTRSRTYTHSVIPRSACSIPIISLFKSCLSSHFSRSSYLSACACAVCDDPAVQCDDSSLIYVSFIRSIQQCWTQHIHVLGLPGMSQRIYQLRGLA